MIPKQCIQTQHTSYSGFLFHDAKNKPVKVTIAILEKYLHITPEVSMQVMKYQLLHYREIIGVEYLERNSNTQSIVFHLCNRDIQIGIKITDLEGFRNLLRIQIPQKNFVKAYEIKQIVCELNDGEEIIQCCCKASGKEYAAKILRNSSNKREIQINQLLARNPHENILSMLEYYQNAKETIFVLPFLKGGTLNQLMAQLMAHKVKLQQIQVKSIMKQILKGLGHIHGLNIIHRDIKMDNIMVEEEDDLLIKVRIIDFGLAIMKNEADFQMERCGTVGYLAPEIIAYDQYNQSCDIFSLAQVFHILLTGHPTYDRNIESEQILLMTAQGQLKIDRQAIHSAKAINLIENMMKLKDQRFTVSQCLNHEYFKQPKLIEKYKAISIQGQMFTESKFQVTFLNLSLL